MIVIFGLAKEKASLNLGGGLSQCYIHDPIMSSQEKLLFKMFMLGFSQQLLHARYFLYWFFYEETIEFRRDLLEIIKCNSEDWDSDEGKESGITPKFDCVESFMDTDALRI